MVIASAGRRIDAAGAHPTRFALESAPRVAERVRDFLREHGVTTVVCSAACGADLIVLAEAETLGLRRRVILPYAAERFRFSSVADRPGGWASQFDSTLASLMNTDDLIILGDAGADPFQAANEAILTSAISIARADGTRVAALRIWDGDPRAGTDYSASFALDARRRGLPLFDLLTS